MMLNRNEMIEIAKNKFDELKRFIKERPKHAAIAGVGILFFIILLFVIFGGEEIDSNGSTFEAKKGPLVISLTETGTIQARERIIVKNEVEGNTSIIFIVDEGTEVKKGDLLVELDSSNLTDQKIDQEIMVQNAEASFIGARENFAVTENQAKSDIDNAQLSYDFAVQDLDKYKKGEYPKQLKEAESKITLAEEEYKRAEDKLDWSKKLFDDKYLSKIELQADELSYNQKKLSLDLAKEDLKLLQNYTHKRQLDQLTSDVKQAEMALERTTRKSRADVVQSEANLKAKEAEYNRQKDRLEKLKTQLEKTKIYAPADGLVLYATSAGADRGPRFMSSQEPLDEGSSVRERQELIHLPTTAGFNAKIGIYESSLDKVRPGLPVRITVDSLPGQQYRGKVTNVAPVPDAMSSFMSPDLSIYDTIIEIENSDNINELRSGNKCTAEIIIDQYTDAIYVPVQAVIRVDNKPTVYVVKRNKLRPRQVETGLSNNLMIRIIDGLKEGEVVSLTPPLAQAAVSQSMTEIIEDIPTDRVPDSSGQSAAPRSNNQSPGFEGGIGGMEGGMPSMEDMMKRQDKDGDGKISKSEVPPFLSENFDQMDKNGNGFLEPDEMVFPDMGSGQFGPQPGGQGFKMPSKEDMMKRQDKDGDGKVTENEFMAFPGTSFNDMDKNGDGYITLDEFEIPDFSSMGGMQGGGGGRRSGMQGGDFSFPGGGGR